VIKISVVKCPRGSYQKDQIQKGQLDFGSSAIGDIGHYTNAHTTGLLELVHKVIYINKYFAKQLV